MFLSIVHVVNKTVGIYHQSPPNNTLLEDKIRRFQRSQPTRGGTVWQLQMPANRDQLISWQSSVQFNRFSASGQFDAAELIRFMITKPQQRQTDQTHLKLIQMSGDVHPNPGPATKYPCPVCTRNFTSCGVRYKCTKCYGWVHAKWSGILNAAQYRRKSGWTCDACSAHSPRNRHLPTRSPAPPTKQISEDSMFNILQLNANGIGNKLTELEVVLERNKVKVAVIQESKLSHKSKNPCIQNYTTVRKDRSHGQRGGLLIFIYRSPSKQPSSPESSIRSPPGRTFIKSWTRKYEVDHFQRLHTASQFLQ